MVEREAAQVAAKKIRDPEETDRNVLLSWSTCQRKLAGFLKSVNKNDYLVPLCGLRNLTYRLP